MSEARINDRINWGRWGDDDQRGTLNLIDATKLLGALALPTEGRTISLAIPIQRKGVPIHQSRNPPLHLMSSSGADYAAGKKTSGNCQRTDSYLTMSTHGTTHIDAFSHMWYDDLMYNGFSGNDIRSDGARNGGIDRIGPVITRGVLLDFCALHGVDHLEESHLITVEEVQEAERSAGVEIAEGDAVLTRTGWLDMFWDEPDRFHGPEPGIGLGAANYLADKGAALIGADNYGVEVAPPDQAIPGYGFPVHVECLRNRGLHLIELLDLRELAATGRGAFLFIIAPLRITGGVGSPLNPIAVL